MNTSDSIPVSIREKFWLISADMGYGHTRAIYPLKKLAIFEEIVVANNSPYSTKKEIKLWQKMLSMYEFLSRAGKIPVIGVLLTGFLDRLLYIPKYYPIKDHSKPTLQVRYLKKRIKNGLCKGIIEEIQKPELPIITSFYAPAIACEIAQKKNVYCIICDTDLSRAWVVEDPSTTKIKYFASCSESVQRLKSYGVPENNILLTGFPLPLELLGNRNLDVLLKNLSRRLSNLDPDGKFNNLYKHSINAYIPDRNLPVKESNEKASQITITYVVGGAGAQKETGEKIAYSLTNAIYNDQVKLNLVAGTRVELRDYFNSVKDDIAPYRDNVQIIWAENFDEYYDLFNKCLHTTDILWTKPSELSFYCALGIPIITTPAIGPQEKFNRRWLRETGAGFKQKNPEYTDQWLFDLIRKGRLAEAAWLGFLKGRKYGTYNIMNYFEKGSFTASNDPLSR